jgi:hypothetical protein
VRALRIEPPIVVGKIADSLVRRIPQLEFFASFGSQLLGQLPQRSLFPLLWLGELFRAPCGTFLAVQKLLCLFGGHRLPGRFEHHRQVEGRTEAPPLDVHVVHLGHLVTIRAK